MLFFLLYQPTHPWLKTLTLIGKGGKLVCNRICQQLHLHKNGSDSGPLYPRIVAIFHVTKLVFLVVVKKQLEQIA